MKLVALSGLAAVGVIGQTAPSDPVTTFAQLGITGLVSLVLFLWRQETARKLDQATKLNEQLIPLMTRVLDVVQASNAAHENSARAMNAASESLQRVPTEETFTRIKVALERSEVEWQRSRDRRGD
jgi:hypothetical protein